METEVTRLAAVIREHSQNCDQTDLLNSRVKFFLSCIQLTYLLTYFLTYLLTYSLTHSLTPHTTILLEKLTGSQLVKKFPAFYGTRSFITAFITARHLWLS